MSYIILYNGNECADNLMICLFLKLTKKISLNIFSPYNQLISL